MPMEDLERGRMHEPWELVDPVVADPVRQDKQYTNGGPHLVGRFPLHRDVLREREIHIYIYIYMGETPTGGHILVKQFNFSQVL